MSDYKAKMHPIRLLIGLRPVPAGKLTAHSQLDLRESSKRKDRKGRERPEGRGGDRKGGEKEERLCS